MNWQSVPLLSLFDTLALLVVAYAAWRYVRTRREMRHATESGGALALLGGLILIGLFFAADLVAMLLLPQFLDRDAANAVMRSLHLDWSWFILVGGLGLIAVGFGRFLRYFTESEVESRRQQVALAESESRFQDFAETASDWMYEMDAEFRFTNFWDAEKGISPRGLIGKTRWEAAGGDPERDETWRRHRDVLEARKNFRGLEYWLPDSDDVEPRYVRVNGKPIFDENGAFRGYRGTALDITESKLTERRLLEAEALFRALLDNAPVTIAIRDTEGRYLMVNKAYEAVFATTIEELRGKTAHDLFPKDYADMIEARERDVLESGRAIATELPAAPNRSPSGTILAIRFPIADSEGRITRIGLVGMDISERKKVEEALLAAKEEAEFANRAKSEFLAKMSHELRTPLNAIIGFAQTLDQGIFGPLANERYESYAHDIVVSGQHLLNLISDLLDISRIESGELTLNVESFDLEAMLAEARIFVEAAIAEKAHRLEKVVPADLPKLRVDARAVRQVLLNLLSNAVKFTAPGGTIRVEASQAPEDMVRISISDTGAGIPAGELAEIRTPFYQGSAGRNSTEPGTGLGLAIVDSLVRLHGGRLDIESEVGVGTTVTVHLPASSGNSDEARPTRLDATGD